MVNHWPPKPRLWVRFPASLPNTYGEVPERSNGTDCNPVDSWVQIPPSPLNNLYGVLVKRLKTQGFHSCIHGFESHTRHHKN